MSTNTEKEEIETVIAPRVGQCEYPYTVASYNFKHLDEARDYSLALAAIKNTAHRHKVKTVHRRIVKKVIEKGKEIAVQSIVLDVTTDSVEIAEQKYDSKGGLK